VTEYARLREIMAGAGGFVYAGWCGSEACETTVKGDTSATIRCIPDEEFRSGAAPAACLVCGGKAPHEVVWARAY
jgi:prolyl-tRNA synthetase